LINTMGGANQIMSFNPVVIAADNGVFISDDNGMNFSQADLINIDGTDAPDDFTATSIEQNENSIFLRGFQGLAYSHDTGNSWSYVDATSVVQFAGWEGRLVRNKSNSFPPFETQESTDGGATWQNITGLETQFTGPEFMWMMNDSLFIQNDQMAPSPGQISFLAENSTEWSEASWYGAIPDQIISAESTADGRTILGTRNSGAWVLNGEFADFISDMENTDLLVYPNPATNYLHIKSADGLQSELTIFNSSGIPIYYQKEAADVINISFLETGIYFIVTQNKTLTFIKQ